MAKSKKVFKVGDRVKLTPEFLKSTGQYTGGEAQKVWTVVHVNPGKRGLPDFISVDEKREDLSYWTKEELEADPILVYRLISASNLKLASRPDSF